MSLHSRIQVATTDPNEPEGAHEDADRSSVVADPFAELKTRVHKEIIPRLGPRLFNQDGKADGDLEEKVNEVVTEMLAVEKTPLTRQERQEIIRQITDDILGYGPLEPFLRDDSITEVMVNDHKTVYIERHGKITRTNAAVRRRGPPAADHRQDHQPHRPPHRRVLAVRRRAPARRLARERHHPAARSARLLAHDQEVPP